MAGRALILLAVAVLVTVTVLVVRSWSRRRVGGLHIDGAARLWSALEPSRDRRRGSGSGEFDQLTRDLGGAAIAEPDPDPLGQHLGEELAIRRASDRGSPDATGASYQLHRHGQLDLITVDRRLVVGDFGAADHPAAAAPLRPLAAVAGCLGMGRRELLGPAQVNGMVDVTPAVELVAAHRPAQGELERIGALRIGDHTYSLARSSLSLSSEGGASNLQVKELGHLVLYVRNLERSRGFYRDVLGWKEITVSGEEVGFAAAACSSGRTHHELLLLA